MIQQLDHDSVSLHIRARPSHLRPRRRRHPHARDQPGDHRVPLARRGDRSRRRCAVQGPQQDAEPTDVRATSRWSPSPTRAHVRVRPHRALRRHGRVAVRLRPRRRRHARDRVIHGDQARLSLRLVHHRHAVRSQGPPDRSPPRHDRNPRTARAPRPERDTATQPDSPPRRAAGSSHPHRCFGPRQLRGQESSVGSHVATSSRWAWSCS